MQHALYIEEVGGAQAVTVRSLEDDAFPAAPVTVAIEYSTLNYKDALALTSSAPVVRTFPMVPGIDFAGTVTQSEDPRFPEGAAVLANGWGMGETAWGGLSTLARVSGDWLTTRPDGMTAKTAMAFGTAGYTAALSVLALENHGVTPQSGSILVTGATGGVGSVAVALLSKAGYAVVAATGKADAADYLTGLGAQEVIDRSTLLGKVRPLAKEQWAGAVDTAGGTVLANVLAGISYGGAVAACGLAHAMDLPTSVAPFILRGVALLGIESVYAPQPLRDAAWGRLARDIDPDVLHAMVHEIRLTDCLDVAPKFMSGAVTGRYVVACRDQ